MVPSVPEAVAAMASKLAAADAEQSVAASTLLATPARGAEVAATAPVMLMSLSSPSVRESGPALAVDTLLQTLLVLLDDGQRAGTRPALEFDAASTRNALLQALDRLKDEAGDRQADVSVTIGTTALVSSGLSVGYVLWMLRGGVLVATVMSSVPAWAGFDPLPVLSRSGGAADDDEDDDDPVERLFARARRLVHRGSVAGAAARAVVPPGSAATAAPVGGPSGTSPVGSAAGQSAITETLG